MWSSNLRTELNCWLHRLQRWIRVNVPSVSSFIRICLSKCRRKSLINVVCSPHTLHLQCKVRNYGNISLSFECQQSTECEIGNSSISNLPTNFLIHMIWNVLENINFVLEFFVAALYVSVGVWVCLHEMVLCLLKWIRFESIVTQIAAQIKIFGNNLLDLSCIQFARSEFFQSVELFFRHNSCS